MVQNKKKCEMLRRGPVYFSEKDPARQEDVLELVGPPLGWKNLTALARLRVDVGSLKRNSLVFVKAGEREESCHATWWYYRTLDRLGFSSLASELIFMDWTRGKWEECIALEGVPERHARMLEQKLAKPRHGLCILVERFDGVLMQNVRGNASLFGTPMFCASFLRTLLLDKLCGLGDLNEHNLMIQPETGEVMRVDVSQGTRARITGDGLTSDLMPYNERRLQTAQKLNQTKALECTQSYVRAHFAEVAKMIRALLAFDHELRGPGVQYVWFDDADEMLKRLEAGERRAVDLLCNDIVRYDLKRKAVLEPVCV
jgi:hypothetical protein